MYVCVCVCVCCDISSNKCYYVCAEGYDSYYAGVVLDNADCFCTFEMGIRVVENNVMG